jgi:hypothetical protein
MTSSEAAVIDDDVRVINRRWISVSSGFGEADDLSVLPEALPAQEQVVLADETDLAPAAPALAAVLAELAGVGSPEKVGHLWSININYLY